MESRTGTTLDSDEYVFEVDTSDDDRQAVLSTAVANLEASPSESVNAHGRQLREAIASGYRGGTREQPAELPTAVGDAVLVEAGGSRTPVSRAQITVGMRCARATARRLARGSRANWPMPRPRGGGRPKGRTSSARRSSERSGDSGEASEPPDRPCQLPGCDRQIPSGRSPKADHCSDRHAALARQWRKRQKERDWSPDVSRRDPYLRVDPEEAARLIRRVEIGCRCNGHHIADPQDHHCIKCGHDRAGAPVRAGSVTARSAETRRPRNMEMA
jgi:hypothetical protein